MVKRYFTSPNAADNWRVMLDDDKVWHTHDWDGNVLTPPIVIDFSKEISIEQLLRDQTWVETDEQGYKLPPSSLNDLPETGDAW